MTCLEDTYILFGLIQT